MFTHLLLSATIITSTSLPSNDINLPIEQNSITISTSDKITTSEKIVEPSETVELIESTEFVTNETGQVETTIEQSASIKLSENSATQTISSITITNAIEPNMLAYKHWTGTYTPEIFTIHVNGVEVAQGAQHTIPAEPSTLAIKYTYSFMNGMRTGTKTISYKLHENISQAAITFSWKDNWKVLVDNGTALEEITA